MNQKQSTPPEVSDEKKAGTALRALKLLVNEFLITPEAKDEVIAYINLKYNHSQLFITSNTKGSCPIRVFKGMVRRCYNPLDEGYDNYGGRGIRICDEWLNNKNLFNDWCVSHGWKPGLQVDRIDVNGDYSPNNCRLVNNKTNSRNTRKTLYAEFKGKRRPLIEWCEVLNVKYFRVYSDMRRNNISATRALEKQLLKNKKKMLMGR